MSGTTIEATAADRDEADTVSISLKGSQTAIFGLKGSGKSNWLQFVLDQHADKYQNHIMYDVCREHDSLNRYIPSNRVGEEAEAELDGVLGQLVVNQDREYRPELVAVEEVSRFCSPNSRPPGNMYELVDLNRHYGVGMLTIGRRPAQIHTDLTELADNVIIFKLTGKNDYRRLEAEVEGLGDAVRSLNEYEYVYLGKGREYHIMEPVPEMDTTGRL